MEKYELFKSMYIFLATTKEVSIVRWLREDSYENCKEEEFYFGKFISKEGLKYDRSSFIAYWIKILI